MYKRQTMPDALKKADEVLQQAVQGITDLINLPALINLDSVSYTHLDVYKRQESVPGCKNHNRTGN